MKFSAIILASLATLTMASPAIRSGGFGRTDTCLCEETAGKVAAAYADLIGAYTEEKAQSLLTEDFSDTSDSINVLAGLPLGGPTFPTKAIFIEQQANFPPIPLAITSIDAFSCNVVVLRWTQTFGQPGKEQPVAGIAIVYAKKVDDEWKLQKIFTEFNSLTYNTNIGGVCTPPAKRS